MTTFYSPWGKAKSLHVPLHLTLNSYHRPGAFQPTDTHTPLHINREQLVLKSSNRLLERSALALQPAVTVNFHD
jgi:hypothetical protein